MRLSTVSNGRREPYYADCRRRDFRFVQVIAALAIWLGLTFASALFEYLSGIAGGQPWEMGELSMRVARFSAPITIGGFIFVGLQLCLRHGRILHERSLRYPDQPWMWRPEWAERRIRLSNRTSIFVCAAAFTLYFFVVVPVGFWMASIKLATGIYWFVGICGAVLLAFARLAWMNRRWGASDLAISTLPGVIGGPFAGIVTISEAFPEGTPFRVTLRCVLRRTTRARNGETSHSYETTLWQAQKVVSRSIAADRPKATSLPCYFAVPYECSPTGDRDGLPIAFLGTGEAGRQVIRWELCVAPKDEADVRKATFEVPVFKTAQSSPDYREDESIDRPFLEPVNVEALLERIAYDRIETASGERHVFSLFQLGPFFGLLAFTMAIGLGTWAIFKYVDFPISAFAGLIPGALTIMGIVVLIEMLSWKAKILIQPDGVVIVAGALWSRRTYQFPRGATVTLECAEEYRREAGSAWCVRLSLTDEKPCPVVKRLDGKQEAVAIRDWLERRIKARAMS